MPQLDKQEWLLSLADLLGYEVHLAADKSGKWFVYLVPVEPIDGPWMSVWAYIETDDVDFIPAPDFGTPDDWKTTLITASPRETT